MEVKHGSPARKSPKMQKQIQLLPLQVLHCDPKKKKRKKGNILRLLSPISKTQREDASVKTRLGSIINKKARNDSAVNTQ